LEIINIRSQQAVHERNHAAARRSPGAGLTLYWQAQECGLARRPHSEINRVLHISLRRILRAISECAPQIEDDLLHCLWLDESAGRHRIEKFIMRHQPSGVLRQIAQNRERLGR